MSVACLLPLSGCGTLFPETTLVMDRLPESFWVNLSDLGWGIGLDLYGWVEFLVDIAL